MPDIDYTQPAVPDAATRLRDAFALLLMRGHDQAVPAEAMWQAQGQGQFPSPQTPPTTEALGPNKGWPMPMPEAPATPGLNLPVAPAEKPPQPTIDPDMFPDAKSLTVRPSPFTLPKKAKR